MPYAVENITIASASREELPIVARLAERIWPEAYRTILDEGQIRYMLKMMYDLPVLEKEYGEGTRFDLIFENAHDMFLPHQPVQSRRAEGAVQSLISHTVSSAGGRAPPGSFSFPSPCGSPQAPRPANRDSM